MSAKLLKSVAKGFDDNNLRTAREVLADPDALGWKRLRHAPVGPARCRETGPQERSNRMSQCKATGKASGKQCKLAAIAGGSRILNGKHRGPKLPAMWFGSRPVIRREDLEAYKAAKVEEGRTRS